LLGAELDRHRALAFDQAADDFHGGRDPMHLSLANGGFALLIKSLSLFAAGVNFGMDPIDRLNRRHILFLKLFSLRFFFLGQGGEGG
jgi:hypothetical protein